MITQTMTSMPQLTKPTNRRGTERLGAAIRLGLSPAPASDAARRPSVVEPATVELGEGNLGTAFSVSHRDTNRLAPAMKILCRSLDGPNNWLV